MGYSRTREISGCYKKLLSRSCWGFNGLRCNKALNLQSPQQLVNRCSVRIFLNLKKRLICIYRVSHMDLEHFKELCAVSSFLVPDISPIIFMVEKCVHFDIWNRKISLFQTMILIFFQIWIFLKI